MVLEVVLSEPGRFARREVRPAEAGDRLAHVRVHRVGVCGTDIHAFHGRQPFLEYPRVLGHELGVEVLAVPPGDHGLRPGDRCAVEPYLHDPGSPASRRGLTNCCEDLRVLGVHTDGGMRGDLALPVDKLHRSDRLGFDQLAAVEMLCIGAHAVERAGIGQGDFVAVVGLGPIGLSTLAFVPPSAGLVAAVDTRAGRRQFCREQFPGAPAIDPSTGDVAAALRALSGGDLPGVVIDATGNGASMAAACSLAAHGGRVVFVGITGGAIAVPGPTFHRRELTLLASRNAPSRTFRDVVAALESGAVDPRPWVTHRMALADVPEQFGAVTAAPDLVKAVIEVDR
jgi:threonine dehydrogenase-like Zn-dependent dehydrogenase